MSFSLISTAKTAKTHNSLTLDRSEIKIHTREFQAKLYLSMYTNW